MTNRMKYQWCRLWSDIIDDPKLTSLPSDSHRWLWIKLLAHANQQPDRGLIDQPMETIAADCHCEFNFLRECIRLFNNLQMTRETGEGLLVINFNNRNNGKRPSDAPDKVKDRVARHREKKILEYGQAANTEPVAPIKEILQLWKELLPGLPQVVDARGWRRERVELKWREHPDLAEWKKLFEHIKLSNFLTGGGPRGWRADFDWILKADNWQKVLEGSYDAVKERPRPKISSVGPASQESSPYLPAGYERCPHCNNGYTEDWEECPHCVKGLVKRDHAKIL